MSDPNPSPSPNIHAGNLPATYIFDTTAYTWIPSHNAVTVSKSLKILNNNADKVPLLYRRRALAGENLWLLRQREARELFLGGDLSLAADKAHGEIVDASRSAWRALRWECPELVLLGWSREADGDLDGGGERFVEFRIPDGEEDVQRWVQKTLIFSSGSESLGFDQLRTLLCEKKLSEPDPAFMYLHTVTSGPEKSATRLEFMLNMDHLVTDGIGIRVLLGKFLQLFSDSLGPEPKRLEVIDWSKSARNLSPAWAGIMNGAQRTSGPEFEEAVEGQFKFLLSDTSQSWGLTLHSIPPSQQHLENQQQQNHISTLSAAKSHSLLQNIKNVLGATGTVTHVCHAAVILAILRTNPLPPFSSNSDIQKENSTETKQSSSTPTPLFSPCWMNGRSYLSLPSKPPQNTYVPLCQALGQITFRDIRRYSTIRTDTESKILKEVLLDAAREAGVGYAGIKERKGILAESGPLMEELGRMMWRGRKGSEAVDGERKRREEVDPFLLSDGIGERYTSRSYCKEDGKEVLEINTLRFVANAEGPNLIVRLGSWRDEISVSGEWREEDYERGVVVGFLEDVVALLNLLVGDNVSKEGDLE